MKESAVGWTYMLSARYVRRAKRLSQYSLMVVPSTLKQIALTRSSRYMASALLSCPHETRGVYSSHRLYQYELVGNRTS